MAVPPNQPWTTISGCPSSFRIVPDAWLLTIEAPTALLKFTTKYWSSSYFVSPITFTVIVPLIWPAGIVSVPLAAR